MATTCTSCGEDYKGNNYDAHVFSRGHPTSRNPNDEHRRAFKKWTDDGIALAIRGQFQSIEGPLLWAMAVVILRKPPGDSRLNSSARRDELICHYKQPLIIEVPLSQEPSQADILRRMLEEDYGLLPLSFKTDTLHPIQVHPIQVQVQQVQLEKVLEMFDPFQK